MKTFTVTREPVPFSARQSNNRQFCALFGERVIYDDNTQRIVASSFARSEPMIFFLVGMFKCKQYSNPHTENCLKEKSNRTLHCFHFHKKTSDVEGTSGFVRRKLCLRVEGKCFSSAFFNLLATDCFFKF